MAVAFTGFLSVATGNEVNGDRHSLISEFALEPEANFKETA